MRTCRCVGPAGHAVAEPFSWASTVDESGGIIAVPERSIRVVAPAPDGRVVLQRQANRNDGSGILRVFHPRTQGR